MIAIRRSKTNEVFIPSEIRVNLTIADFQVSHGAAPFLATCLMGALYMLYDPPLGITTLCIAFVGECIAFWWFKVFLADDYAIEGARSALLSEKAIGDSGTAISGRIAENLLDHRRWR